MGALVDDGIELGSIQVNFIDLIDHHEWGHMTGRQTFHRLEREQLIRRGLARLDAKLFL
jgi:hypothetical protein